MGYPDVEGYGVRSEGETYHPSADFDPKVVFANAGDTVAAGEVEPKEYVSNVAESPHEQSNADPATANPDPEAQLPITPEEAGGTPEDETTTQVDETKVDFN